jgi:hypothetical protein
MISPNTKILVSKHAKERIVQRFDRLIPPYGSHSELMIVISKMVRAGQHLTDWKRVPFYYNAISTKNGGDGTEFVSYHGHFVFVCRYKPEEDVLVVVTAVTNMLYYPAKGTFAVGTAGGAKYVNEAKFLAGLEIEALVEYRQKHGNTPQGAFIELKKQKREEDRVARLVIHEAKMLAEQTLKQEKSEFDLDAVLTQCYKPGTAKLRSEINGNLYQKVKGLNKSIRSCNSLGPLEQLYAARRERLVKLGLQIQNEDAKMYLHLISIAKFQVETQKSAKAAKALERYRAELQKLTVDNTEN